MVQKTAVLLLVGGATPASAEERPPGRFEIGALDRSADPCVDSHQFACGRWRARTPIPPDQTRWGRFNALAERNREELLHGRGLRLQGRAADAARERLPRLVRRVRRRT